MELTFQDYLKEDKEYQQLLEKQDYSDYLKAISLFEQYKNNTLNEGILDTLTSSIKDKYEFIKTIASNSNQKLEDIISLFKNSKVYNFFKKIGWSIKEFFQMIQNGYKAYVNFHKVIHQWLLDNKYTSSFMKWTDEKIKELHDFLEQNPMIKKMSGPIISGFLLYMWFESANLGEIGDFDTSDIFKALTGHYNLYNLLGNGALLKVLITLILGVSAKLSFPYPTPNDTKFIIGTLIALTKTFNIHTKIIGRFK